MKRNKNIKDLVNTWCYSSNIELCNEIEKELDSRGIELTAENIQRILLVD